MKKVILGAAALIFAAGMYGQANPAPPQAPAQALGLTSSSPDPNANMGESVQNGNANKVLIQQAGTNQMVYTKQDDGTGTGGNRAWIAQTGQVSGASGVENAAEVHQSGSLNQSKTLQEGDYNEALTRQGQNNLASSENKAFIHQGTGQQAQDNKAGVDQDGIKNQARTLQTYDNSVAWTKQVGDENTSDIKQNAGPNQTDGHKAEVDQTGDDNASWINQYGAGATNEAVTFQLGTENNAIQVQQNTAGSGGSVNNAMISQGDFFTGNFFPSIWSDLVALDGSIDDGSYNGASHAATAFQFQQGTDNLADIRQFSDAPAGGNYAEQNQIGDSNKSFMVQNLYGTSTGGDNYGRQDQTGDNNIAGLSQAGLNHKAYQRQYGDGNEALSTQRGNGNLLNTYQGGNDNYVESLQHGTANQALLVQKGGHSFSLKQNEGDFTGGGNFANVLQLGPDGDFIDDAENCIFPNQETVPTFTDISTYTIDAPCPGC